MIQRIQSIFYLLAIEDLVFNIQDHIVLLVMACLGGGVALLNIFLFKNRSLQIRLGYLLIILGVLLPIVAGLLIMTDGTATEAGEEIKEHFGLAMPVIAIVLSFLANKYVKKDQSLVQSMDRLR